jgi:3-hydroxyacyl-CoA dehydrogenase
MGLVETGVGLIPCWGGCKEYLGRCHAAKRRPGGPIPPVAAAFETIALAKVSNSAFEARELGFLSQADGISMNRSRLLADAKAKALSMMQAYRPPQPMTYALPGKSARCLLDMNIQSLRSMGRISAYDAEIGGRLADVLTGGEANLTRPVTEDDLLALEARSFLALADRPQTRARLEHMLKIGKPLRN